MKNADDSGKGTCTKSRCALMISGAVELDIKELLQEALDSGGLDEDGNVVPGGHISRFSMIENHHENISLVRVVKYAT